MSIYVIHAAGTEWYKIGYTEKDIPDRRVVDMQVGCPHHLSVLMFFRGERRDERSLHFRFREVRGLGEWFDLSAADIGWLWDTARARGPANPYQTCPPTHRDCAREVSTEELIAVMRARKWSPPPA